MNLRVYRTELFDQIMDITPSTLGPMELCYDPEWLSILLCTNQFLSTNYSQPELRVSPEELKTMRQFVAEKFKFESDYIVPLNFTPTAPIQTYKTAKFIGKLESLAGEALENPQTDSFCSWLGIENKMRINAAPVPPVRNPEEILIEEDETETLLQNPEEIVIPFY